MTEPTNYLALANERFAWPGGYEMFFVTDDSGVLCAPCVVTEWVDTISVSDEGDGWHIVAVGHEGELDEPVNCDHCYREIGGDE
jgi:hypothetical protein